jgi:hypothetical protein
MTASTRDLKAGLKVAGSVAYTGDISPAQLAANTDNWAPTGLETAAVIRVSTDASRNLTGLTGGADGRIITLMNVGSFDLVLKHDVTSTAANRFYCPDSADFTLKRNMTAILNYDATSSRWRVTGGGGGASAVAEKIMWKTFATGGFGESWRPNIIPMGSNSGSYAQSVALSTTKIYASPLSVPGGTLDRMSFNVTGTGGANNARQGIYESVSATDPYPGALVVDSGDISVNATGLKTSTISVVIDPAKMYWIVLQTSSGAPSVTAWVGAQFLSPYGTFGDVNFHSFSYQLIMFSMTRSYAALPSTYPALASPTWANPMIHGVRYSA